MNIVPIRSTAYKIIIDTLESISQTAPTEEDKSRLTIDSIISILEVIEENQAKAAIETFPLLEEYLLIAKLYVAGIGGLGLSLKQGEENDFLFPSNWISEAGVPNPNFILSNQLIQIANHALSVINLCMSGLDNPARTLCRTTAELTQQTLVLFSDPDELRHWMKGGDPTESAQTWYQLFAKNRLETKLKNLETKICIDISNFEIIEKNRNESFVFNSMAVHHSYLNGVAGAYSLPALNSEELDCALFGKANAASANTIHDLIISLHYFSSMFFAMIFRLHEFQLKDHRDTLFIEGYAAIESAKNILLNLGPADA